MKWLRTFLCGLGGHEFMRTFEPNRIALRCMNCPYETPGWTLKDKGSVSAPLRSPRWNLVAERGELSRRVA